MKCAHFTCDTCGAKGELMGHSLSEPPQVRPRRMDTPLQGSTRMLSLLLVISILALQETRTEITPRHTHKARPATVQDETGRRCNRQTSGQGSHWLSQQRALWWSEPAFGPQVLFQHYLPGSFLPTSSQLCGMRPKLYKCGHLCLVAVSPARREGTREPPRQERTPDPE